MRQFILIALFVIVLLVGAFAYFDPSLHSINPMKFFKDKSGYSSKILSSSEIMKEANVAMDKALFNSRQQMEDLAKEQKEFLDSLKDRQRLLESQNKNSYDVRMEAQQRIDDEKQRMQDLKNR